MKAESGISIIINEAVRVFEAATTPVYDSTFLDFWFAKKRVSRAEGQEEVGAKQD